MRIAALLMAAGTGSRFGTGLAKQFQPLGSRPVLRHAAEALLPHVDLLQPVGDAGLIAPALQDLERLQPPVAGGATRQQSVRLGLEALDRLPDHQRCDLVLVHDGARPYVPASLVRRVIEALSAHRGAIPAVPVADTLKRGAGGLIEATVPRAGLFRAQTPQGFDFATLRDLHRAHAAGPHAGIEATDDAALLEHAGIPVALVAGSDDNIKLTYEEDLMRLERLIGPVLLPRTGTGFDVHAFVPADGEPRPLMLCGIAVPFERGLAGHSDADVGLHALCDAIYGALAEGDIGRHFPPSEATWKDADSARFLVHAGERIAARGGILVNADVTLICERPKIGPHSEAMRARLAELLRVEIGRISVKATTTERLGFTGRGEGIACQASATVLVP
ncbi:2-C-methyl-D-erythritol 4-phosphate cytidylyltransferase [Lichenicoccus roseus]|uniref:Bifunctional enzyme IspD/IspF n=1 Tax=Lichenicoccus roseus TaxID=2683649 RepID=A0A5R9J6Q4_9PROT|nr:2-C-methyl-D-erythritol 4-phosphate cytidylyltransferase [Lichenicoccus roseus]TLU72649.1 2-C-methyl-D-erythritol 4-phosphate cytidylyltransferase [Lichenicoccus roseus]